MIRVGGHLDKSNLRYDAKHPSLLPNNHTFTRLIITYEHIRHFHAGAQATLASVRKQFWPCSGRGLVPKILKGCVTCARFQPKTSTNLMGQLPNPRVNVPTRPFINTGVDYGGPLYHQVGMRRSARLEKCYICIFVCFATKAVHIELALDMSTESFLNAFKRFVARRGLPENVYSDNGSNFVGAAREMTELYNLLNKSESQETVLRYASKERINWHFIPPYALHQGGLWEAGIKSAKSHLLCVTKDTKLRFEELQTLTTQVEGILNSRPITTISSDPNDLVPLTPGHFLIGDSLTSYPEPTLENIPSNRLSRWQHVEQLRQHLWRRWIQEYLHQWQQRSKWFTEENQPKLGEIVVLQEENLPPLSWSLGLIEQLHPGEDGIVRVVSVRTSKGFYKRPISKVCKLPIDNE